jgi:hypothetical protein
MQHLYPLMKSSMKANAWSEFHKREEEREELMQQLNRGTREINKNMNDLEGWADRIMGSILRPAGTDAMLWYNNLSTKNGGAPYKREQ